MLSGKFLRPWRWNKGVLLYTRYFDVKKKRTLFESIFTLAPKYKLRILLLRLLLETGPPFFLRGHPSQGLAVCTVKAVPQLFKDPEYWPCPGDRTRDLPHSSQALFCRQS